MNKKEILSILNKDFAIKGTVYFNNNIPNQIGNAIYSFGSNDIQDVIAFIDSSENLDGSSGMIITNDKLYFQFNTKGAISYGDITKLEFKKSNLTALVTAKDCQYSFDNLFINSKKLVDILAIIANLDVEMILTDHEKVAYYVPIVLNDLLNDEYEDIVLNKQQQQKIKEFFHELDLISTLDQKNYCSELELLCDHALKFFDELELDSEEIDILLNLQKKFSDQNDQMYKGAKKYYDDMMHKYQEGDPSMLNQVKSMMQSLGIDEKDLENKSPDQLNQYIEDLCTRFGISKSQLETLAKKFNL